ncbi:hypothetical protein [Natrinema caseinilyticum]|uniref:hypothetical protein n=1 Tax=Natrinema caseinilyticum TaxID=2961570 RepID=UPI0020C34CBF|nr:hypothetical protein [Natrinema caseinilyticum]
MYLGLLSSLPWWIAAPLIQLAVLVFGMALDETYVNRTTVLTGAIGVHIHAFVAGEVGLFVGLYADIGLLIGAYGLYAYVTDAYVGAAFRIVAFFCYSPLSVFLVILTAGPILFGVEPLFVPALAAAGYGNVRLREYLAPNDPYYFGPESEAAFEAAVEAEAETGPEVQAGTATGPSNATAATATDGPAGTSGRASADGGNAAQFGDAPGDGDDDPTGAEPTAASESTERGILPQFMRRI